MSTPALFLHKSSIYPESMCLAVSASTQTRGGIPATRVVSIPALSYLWDACQLDFPHFAVEQL